jgi:hypothetical protein
LRQVGHCNVPAGFAQATPVQYFLVRSEAGGVVVVDDIFGGWWGLGERDVREIGFGCARWGGSCHIKRKRPFKSFLLVHFTQIIINLAVSLLMITIQ